MCDFVSWGRLREAHPSLGLKKGQLLWLTDEMIVSKWGYTADFNNYVGHSGIAKYFGIDESSFVHHESTVKIPTAIAADVNAGRMRRMARAYGREAVKWRFTEPVKTNYRARLFSPHELLLEKISYEEFTTSAVDMFIEVLKHIQALEEFPEKLTTHMAYLLETLTTGKSNPKMKLNPFNLSSLSGCAIVNYAISWNRAVAALRKRGMLVVRDEFSELHSFVYSHWDGVVDELYPKS